MSLGTVPTVSVIVPNYNHARYLRKRVESVLGQTSQNFEVILLDDCSTDESRSIIEEYRNDPRVQIKFNEENSGSVFKQWNKGVRMARGKYVWIAESDDYADNGFLERMVPILEGQPEVTFAYCRSWSVGEDDRRLGFADAYLKCLDEKHWTDDFVVNGIEECRRFFALTNPVPNASAVLFRKEVYEKAGWADEGMRVCGDYKMWAAMSLEGKMAYVAKPLNYFRTHRTNVRTTMQEGALDACEYYYVMLSVLDRIASPDELKQRKVITEALNRQPCELNPRERIDACRRSLSWLEEWNLSHNPQVSREVMQPFFSNLWDILAFREFAVSPPGRWRFFLQRCRFYWHSFPEMSWKLRFVDLIRVLGAAVVGYRHRHEPMRVYAALMGIMRKY
jgi:glycosyltransferase involved in cell wall biosynthesis